MNNTKTELVFILDRSGSMSGYETDTVGGFNATLKRHREEGGADVYVTTVLFNNAHSMLYDRVPIADVPPMQERDFWVGGGTALLDAIGDTVTHIAGIHRYARPEDVPAHTVFVINTDGMENASHRYTADAVRAMIEEKTRECGWEFIFLAANIDAVETAEGLGIRRECAANFRQTHEGFYGCYEAVSDALFCIDCAGMEPIPIADLLSEEEETRSGARRRMEELRRKRKECKEEK